MAETYAEKHLLAARAEWLGIGYLVHPWPIFAVMVLILNDHFLKMQYGNWWTGKISDFAGVFFLPLFSCACFGLIHNYVWARDKFFWPTPRSIFIAILITDLIFVSVKTLPFATDVYLQLMRGLGFPSQLRRDPTDLMALSSNALTYFYARRFWRQSLSEIVQVYAPSS